MATLQELVTPDSVHLDVRAADWREAMRAVGDLLVTSGFSDPSYTQSMIANVEEHGPYIVISPGFAFAHARANDDVHRTGMSWIRLAEPVIFGHPSNDPVGLIAALAATNTSAHMAATRQLATFMENPAHRSALDAATSAEDFRTVLLQA